MIEDKGRRKKGGYQVPLDRVWDGAVVKISQGRRLRSRSPGKDPRPERTPKDGDGRQLPEEEPQGRRVSRPEPPGRSGGGGSRGPAALWVGV
jgi:hypothetical protein